MPLILKMGRKYKTKTKPESSFRITRQRMIIFAVLGVIISGVGVFSYRALTPVNGSGPVFQAPGNQTIKGLHSGDSGYIWMSVASSKVKGIRTSGGNVANPEYTFQKGELESIHVINEDYTTHSKHNFNIDEFNVHTNELGYFESQTITFVADKTGTFEYYCTIHPEMKGKVIIE